MNLQQIAQLGRLAAMEKMAAPPPAPPPSLPSAPTPPEWRPWMWGSGQSVGGEKARGRRLDKANAYQTELKGAIGDLEENLAGEGWKPVTDASEYPATQPFEAPLFPNLLADPKKRSAMRAVERSLHGTETRGAMAGPMREQGTVPLTYQPTTPWPERLFRQRHGDRSLQNILPYNTRTEESGSTNSAWAESGYSKGNVAPGNVPTTSWIPVTEPLGGDAIPGMRDIRDAMNYWQIKNHETEHAFDQPKSPVGDPKLEFRDTLWRLAKNHMLLQEAKPSSGTPAQQEAWQRLHSRDPVSHTQPTGVGQMDRLHPTGGQYRRNDDPTTAIGVKPGQGVPAPYSNQPDSVVDAGVNWLKHPATYQSRRGGDMPTVDEHNITAEVGPSIADLIFRGEQFAKEEGKPLQHTVKLPGGVEHDINWMREQAREHGYWGKDGQPPRSMHDLIFNTPTGRQWYRRMVEGEANKK